MWIANWVRKCVSCGKRGGVIKITDEYANTKDFYCKECYAKI